jgi:hypothetical protein
MMDAGSWVRSKEIPLVIFAIFFLVSIGGYYIDVPLISRLNTELADWVSIMVNIALGTGLIALTLYHKRKIEQRAKGYQLSFIIFVAIVVMFVAMYSGPEISGWLYGTVFTSMQTAVICFALFFEISGAYRAFRVRNIEAFLLMVSGFILIMNFAPIYESMFPTFGELPRWILSVPAMGASRGILIGVGIGTIALAVRILLGYEKLYTR